MKVFLETLGCQMNVLDSELVLGELARRGFTPSPELAEAEVALINTCSVRQHAEDKAVSALGTYALKKREGRLRVIGVLGCMAQNEKGNLFRRVPGIDFVCGPSRLGRVPELVQAVLDGERHLAEVSHDVDRFPVPDHSRRPRKFQAYIEVAFGCDYACAFCIVPQTRGREASRPMREIVDEAKRLVDDGVVEITLLGQTVNAWGRDREEGERFADLLAALDAIPGLSRLKFVTSHPSSCDRAMIGAMRDLPKLCEYLHLPAQSGSDRVLERMRRPYTAGEYRRIISDVRAAVPEVEVASDFIVGFPGETEEDFERTAELVAEMEFVNSFVFKYSPRPRTIAERWDDDVPEEAKDERIQRLLAIQKENSLRKNRARIGTTVEVLVEGPSPRNPARLIGRSRQHQIVLFEAPAERIGQTVSVKIDAATPLTLFGTSV